MSQQAFETSEFLLDLLEACYAYEAIDYVARDHWIANFMFDPSQYPGRTPAYVERKDGSKLYFEVFHNLRWGTGELLAPDMRRSWFTAALAGAADRLEDDGYFDHAPPLELIYHLRNGAAHGNKFNITNIPRLNRHPAYLPASRGQPNRFNIHPSLHGTSVLFDFMAAGDLTELLAVASQHLWRMVPAGSTPKPRYIPDLLPPSTPEQIQLRSQLQNVKMRRGLTWFSEKAGIPREKLEAFTGEARARTTYPGRDDALTPEEQAMLMQFRWAEAN